MRMNHNRADYLMHHGVKGMKWGVRKKSSSGSSSKSSTRKQARAESKASRKAQKQAYKERRKDMKRAARDRKLLSDSDLNKRVKRLEQEKKLKTLTDEDLYPGRKTAGEIMGTFGKNAAKNTAKLAGIAVAGGAAYAAKQYVDYKVNGTQPNWSSIGGWMFQKPKWGK